MKRNPALLTSLLVLTGVLASVSAQPALSRVEGPPVFSTSLPKEEFAARRAKVFQRIGDAVVVMQGATETSAYEKFRQSNQFYYLTGVTTPRAILVMDGRAKTTTLYLNPWDQQPSREAWFRMILITPTGYENISDLAPVEIDAIEKLMAEPGLAQWLRKPSSTASR